MKHNNNNNNNVRDLAINEKQILEGIFGVSMWPSGI